MCIILAVLSARGGRVPDNAGAPYCTLYTVLYSIIIQYHFGSSSSEELFLWRSAQSEVKTDAHVDRGDCDTRDCCSVPSSSRTCGFSGQYNRGRSFHLDGNNSPRNHWSNFPWLSFRSYLVPRWVPVRILHFHAVHIVDGLVT